jgi:hypothetical protein
VFRINGVSEAVQALHPVTAAPAGWGPRPVHPGFPLRLLHDGRRLFISARRDIFFGPTRGGISVYEPPGFSQLAGLTRNPAGLVLSVTADAGRQVIVERTANFQTWTGISTNTAWEGVLEVHDPDPPTDHAHYRAWTSEP